MTRISDPIKRAILTARVSRYQISKDTGIEQAVLSRFVTGKAGLSMQALDSLAEYFGFKLVKTKGK